MNSMKDKQEKLLLGFGFVLVFFCGFFSGFFYSEERINDQFNISIEEPSQNCVDLFNKEYSGYCPDERRQALELQTEKNNSPKNGDPKNAGGLFVGSRNSDVYHKPDCASAAKIKDENKIWFSSEEEAKSKGYRPSKSCFR